MAHPHSGGPQTAGAAEPSLPEWLMATAIGLVGALAYCIPYTQRALFYYVGDNPESFVPLWRHLGQQLLTGQWLTMDPDGWYGGNYAAEAAYTLWNPVSVANYVLVAQFDDLAVAAAVVMIEFLTLLSVGVYLLAREYGARQGAAAVVAVALPASGFTLFYEASGWPAGLMAFTWVTWFWWAARRHARGRLNPFVPFVLGVLAMTTGNPYATLGLVIVLAGIGVELILRRDLRALVHLVVMGLCVGASAVLMFLPLVNAGEVSSRQQLAMIANDGFMVPDLGDLAAASAPSYVPSVINWGGAVRESLPSTYLAWFAVPLLPWLRWSALRRHPGPLVSVTVVTATYLVLVLGPSNLWLFRWPIRLIEYLYLGLVVLLAVVFSAGLALDRLRTRSLTTLGIVAVGGYLSWSVYPEYWRTHVKVSLAVLAMVLAAVLAYRRWGWKPFVGALLVGTLGTVYFQTSRLPMSPPGGVSIEPPRSVSKLEMGTEDYQGTVLQLASQRGVRTQDQDDGELLFGNLPVAAGFTSINRYSGIGFAEFTSALCMDYRGVTCPEAYDKLWENVEPTDVPLVDALRVGTLVLQRSLLPEATRQQPPAGWRVQSQDGVREVWVRTQPLQLPGRVSATTDGIEVVASEATAHHERTRIVAPAGGGDVLFARLAWPGYSATIDGEPVDVINGEAGLVQISVPAGEHFIDLRYEAPMVRLGVLVLLGATGVVVLQTVIWWLMLHRRSPEMLRRSARGDSAAQTVQSAPSDESTEPLAASAGAGSTRSADRMP